MALHSLQRNGRPLLPALRMVRTSGSSSMNRRSFLEVLGAALAAPLAFIGREKKAPTHLPVYGPIAPSAAADLYGRGPGFDAYARAYCDAQLKKVDDLILRSIEGV